MPKPTRDLLRELAADPESSNRVLRRRGRSSRIAAGLVPVIILGLAAYGYYIINYIA